MEALDAQALHDLATDQVLVDDFINIFLVYIGVPDAFRVHHNYGPFLTAVKTTSLVNPDHALAVHIGLLETFLGIITQLRRTEFGAAPAAIFALVLAEKYVPLVVRVGHLVGSLKSWTCLERVTGRSTKDTIKT